MKTFQVKLGDKLQVVQADGALSVIRIMLDREPKAKRLVIQQIFKHQN